MLVFKSFRARGGTEIMAHLLVELFRGLDQKLTVIARHGREFAGARFLRCNPPHLGRLFRHTGFAIAVRRLCDRLEPDLVFSHEHVPGCHVYNAGGGAHVEMFHQTRRVATPFKRLVDTWHPYHRARLRLERRMYESPELAAVICISAMVADDIERRFGLPRERLHVIENGVDVGYFRRDEASAAAREALRAGLGIAADALVLGFVGSGFQRKGLQAAIQALAGARAAAHLVVVGRDRAQRHYQRLARRLGCADRVHFVGKQQDIRPWYWMADALIHPALYEAYGLVVTEAMAAGLPVIASTRCGAALALVRAGETGYLADALDIKALTRAIDAFGEREKRQAMGAAAALAAESHDAAFMKQKLLALLPTLIARQATAAAR